jgi:hypothetical protein
MQISARDTSEVLTDSTNSSNFRQITSLHQTKLSYSETPGKTHYLLRKLCICIFRLIQHTFEYIILNSGYMLRLTGSHHQAFQEHKT